MLADQPVVEMETNKAVVELPSPCPGVVAALHGQSGDVIAVGAQLMSVVAPEDSALEAETSTSGETNVLVGFGPASAPTDRARLRRSPESRSEPRELASGLPGPGPAVVSPVVRRLAFDLGVNLMTLVGTGPRGLILRRDVEAAAAASGGPSPRVGTEHRGQSSTPARTAVSKLVRSRREIPDVTTWVDADATGILEAKAALTSIADQAAITLLGLLARICVLGSRSTPCSMADTIPTTTA